MPFLSPPPKNCERRGKKRQGKKRPSVRPSKADQGSFRGEEFFFSFFFICSVPPSVLLPPIFPAYDDNDSFFAVLQNGMKRNEAKQNKTERSKAKLGGGSEAASALKSLRACKEGRADGAEAIIKWKRERECRGSSERCNASGEREGMGKNNRHFGKCAKHMHTKLTAYVIIQHAYRTAVYW